MKLNEIRISFVKGKVKSKKRRLTGPELRSAIQHGPGRSSKSRNLDSSETGQAEAEAGAEQRTRTSVPNHQEAI